MSNHLEEELLRLNQRLLESIATADWATYQDLCDASLTAFEPEALGQLVEGLEFHRFYFNLGSVTRSAVLTVLPARTPSAPTIGVASAATPRICACATPPAAATTSNVWRSRINDCSAECRTIPF